MISELKRIKTSPPTIVPAANRLLAGCSVAEFPTGGQNNGTGDEPVNQLLQHFPRLEFAALVKKHNAERGAKGFSCRTQLVAMLFCQLAHADSLREICNGLACCVGKLIHLGIGVPNKSSLGYTNQHRPAKLYE